MERMSFAYMVIALVSVFIFAGCESQLVQANIVVPGQPSATNTYVYKASGRNVWISIHSMSTSMGMRFLERNGKLLIGTTDPAYTLDMNNKEAFQGDQLVNLSDVPKRIGSEIYMTDRSITEWWGTPIHWDNSVKQVTVTPADHRALATWLRTYNFTNSPTLKSDYRLVPRPIKATLDVSPAQLVHYAMQLQGLPFQFHATSEEGMHRPTAFNSSSLIRHIYEHSGIELPQTTLSQAKTGITVLASEQILPGDLVFFDSIGPITANRIVAHVGLYIGDGRFLHTYEGSGVTLSDLNDYWRDRFLFAKRILPF
jgi:cell wall-associated NlpC family hydrolase